MLRPAALLGGATCVDFAARQRLQLQLIASFGQKASRWTVLPLVLLLLTIVRSTQLRPCATTGVGNFARMDAFRFHSLDLVLYRADAEHLTNLAANNVHCLVARRSLKTCGLGDALPKLDRLHAHGYIGATIEKYLRYEDLSCVHDCSCYAIVQVAEPAGSRTIFLASLM